MKNLNASTLILGLFGLIGVGLLAGAYLLHQQTRTFAAEATRTEGTVTALVPHQSGTGSNRSTTYRPRVEFLTPEGERIEFVGNFGSNPPAYQPGEKVSVLHSPEPPYRATIDDFWQRSFVVVVLTGMGLVFAIIAITPLWFGVHLYRRRERLRRDGRTIQSHFKGVERASNRRPHRHAFRIVTQWQDPRTGQIHVFRSETLLFDPADYIDRDIIEVRILPDRPEIYLMDCGFLPELASH